MCFSDFPMPADFPNFMHHSKFLQYLRMYADHFQLEQYIRFEMEVVSVEQQQDGGGRWSVTTRKMKDSSDTATETFDAVLVCSGMQSTAKMPTFEGQDEYGGELIHSINYRFAVFFHVSDMFLPSNRKKNFSVECCLWTNTQPATFTCRNRIGLLSFCHVTL